MQPESPSLRALFDAAHELHGAARAEFLARLDPAQRTYLERLLDAANVVTGEGALKVDAASLVAALDEPAPPPLPVSGQQVGPWQLIELIGEGGSSTVFRAAREHAGVRQEAALKLLRRGLYTADAQRQFRRERQALTQLSHPDIASLIEGGVTENGVAYIVLELVDGVPITQYVRGNALELRARLRLFLRVCRAVEAAHRALIVHRDLKPSNVLVSADGHVKLLDFGIAKLLDADDETQTRLPAFTPAYAAPEQRSGALITTATDVYALGVLLGELMTGQRLSSGSNRTPSGQVAGDSAPGVLPASAKATRRQLRGDLDNIVLKAIAEEPERRYASAGAMADDIERLLDGRPVAAHPPSRWYRVRKFVLRHRGSVAITTLFLVAILASLGLAIWQAAVARAEATRAREIQAFIVDMFQPLAYNVSEDKPLTVQDAFQEGFERAVKAFANDLEMRADLTHLFSQISTNLDDSPASRVMAERAYRFAEQAWGPEHQKTLVARHEYAVTLINAGKYSEAVAELAGALAVAKRTGLHDTTRGSILDALAQARTRLGEKEETLLPLVLEAVSEYENAPAPFPRELALAYSHVGVIYHNMNYYDEALAWYAKAMAIDSQPTQENFSYANDLLRVGATHYWMGSWRAAKAEHEQALAMFDRLRPKNNSTRASLLTYLCDEAVGLEEVDAAQAQCTATLKFAEANFGANHQQFATALIRSAWSRILLGQVDDAKRDLARAHDILDHAQGNQSRISNAARLAEASVAYARHDYSQLRALLVPLVAQAERQNQRAPRAFAWFALACAASPGADCTDDAVAQADEVLSDKRFTRHPFQLPAQVALAEVELRLGKPQAAIDRVNQGLSAAQNEIGEKHSWVAQAHLVLASANDALNQAEIARTERHAAEAIIAAQPDGHPLRIWAASNSAAH